MALDLSLQSGFSSWSNNPISSAALEILETRAKKTRIASQAGAMV